jgi:RHS repeat-associated protein
MHVSSSGSISDYYFVQGSNYNIEAMLNSSGNVVETYSLSPYGETRIFDASGTDITATGSAISNTYFFQGRHLDSESGLYYFRNRYYSPDLGRFISRDPIGYAAGDINLYRFVGNGPYGGLDPMGLKVLLTNNPDGLVYNKKTGKWENLIAHVSIPNPNWGIDCKDGGCGFKIISFKPEVPYRITLKTRFRHKGKVCTLTNASLVDNLNHELVHVNNAQIWAADIAKDLSGNHKASSCKLLIANLEDKANEIWNNLRDEEGELDYFNPEFEFNRSMREDPYLCQGGMK